MTAPEQPPAPSVSTAPAEGANGSTASPEAPLRRRRVPGHLGPARTSTVVLAAAFLLVGLLYLFVKPPEQGTADPAGNDSPSTSRSNEPAPQAPVSTAPSSTAPSTSESPTTSGSTTATTSPSETSESPAETTAETTPSEDTAAPTSEPVPTTAAPTS